MAKTPAAPKYTTRAPTVPGLYWYRVGPSEVDRFCRVWRQPKEIGGALVATAGYEGVKDVKLFQRRWAGPLLEPTD